MLSKRDLNMMIILTAILFCMCGCSVQPESNFKQTETIAFQTKTSTLTIVPSKTKTITETEVILNTNTITMTSSVTSTQTPATTPTLLATMADDEKEALIPKLLNTEEDCKFPCFWGIQLGETTWEEVLNRFNQEGVGGWVHLEIENNRIMHGFGLDIYKNHFLGSVDFLEKGGIISQLAIQSEGYNNPTYFQEQWNNYSPKRIVLTYGIPTRVWLQTKAHSRGDRHGYYMWLVYEKYGFIVIYSGFLEAKDKVLRLCPRFGDGEDIMQIELYAQDLKDDTPLEEEGGLIDMSLISRAKPIEYATGLSVEDFYNLFQQNPDEACFETPRDVWE